jgi:heme-degrading monooxygenase HmoA
MVHQKAGRFFPLKLHSKQSFLPCQFQLNSTLCKYNVIAMVLIERSNPMRWKFLTLLCALMIGSGTPMAQAEGLILSDVQASDGTRFAEQLRADVTGPVVLINIFQVPKAEAGEFYQRWTKASDILRRQPGFISTSLHKGVGGSELWLNRAEWQSTSDFAKAMTNIDFLAVAQTMRQPGFRRLYTAQPSLGPLSTP